MYSPTFDATHHWLRNSVQLTYISYFFNQPFKAQFYKLSYTVDNFKIVLVQQEKCVNCSVS